MDTLRTLTPARKALLPRFQEKWTKQGWSTTPCDQAVCTKLIHRAFEALGKPPPKIYFARSPLEGVLTHAILGEGRAGWGFAGYFKPDRGLKIISRSVGDWMARTYPTDESRWLNQIGWHISYHVERALEGNTLRQPIDQLLLQLIGEIPPEGEVANLLSRSLQRLAMDLIHRIERDVPWKEDYLLNGLGLASFQGAAPFIEFAEQASSWLCQGEVFVHIDRPAELHRDEEHRLHNEHGPALLYRDGFAIYAIHGVMVPSQLITDPSSLTAEMIQKEENAELARIMLLKFGEERYAEHFTPKGPPWRDSHGFESQLLETQLGQRTLARVRVTNSTPEPADGTHKIYWLRVPPGMSCAQEALAKIHVNPFRKGWKKYQPMVET